MKTEAGNAVVSIEFIDAIDDQLTHIKNWISFQFRESFIDPLGSFQFRVAPTRDLVKVYRGQLQKGRLIKLYVDADQQACYTITSVRTTVGDDGVVFDCECKSVLATPYEGSVDPNLARSYEGDATVGTVVREVMAPYGFDGGIISATRNVSLKAGGEVPGFLDEPINVQGLTRKEIKALPGETAYGFCSKIFSRLGLALNVAADGQLMLLAPDYEQEATCTLVEGNKDAPQADRMLSPIEITETNDGQFSEVVVLGAAPDDDGQTLASPPGFRLKVANLPERPGTPFTKLPTAEINFAGPNFGYFSDQGSVYKPKIVIDKESRDTETAKRVAYAIMGASASQAFQLRCTVHGLRAASGLIWTVNTVVSVFIATIGFNEEMWVLERTMVQNADGQFTQLTLIPRYSLVLGDPSTRGGKGAPAGGGGGMSGGGAGGTKPPSGKSLYDLLGKLFFE